MARRTVEEIKTDPFNADVFQRYQRDNPAGRWPIVGHSPLDFKILYNSVRERGGVSEISRTKRWKDVARALSLPNSVTNAGFVLSTQWAKFLKPIEDEDNARESAPLLRETLQPVTPAQPAPRPQSQPRTYRPQRDAPSQELSESMVPIASDLSRTMLSPTIDDLDIFDSLPPMVDAHPSKTAPHEVSGSQMAIQPYSQPGLNGFILRDQASRLSQHIKRPRWDETGVSNGLDLYASINEDQYTPHEDGVPVQVLSGILASMTAALHSASKDHHGKQPFDALQPMISFIAGLSDTALLHTARAWPHSLFMICHQEFSDHVARRMVFNDCVDTLYVKSPKKWSGQSWPAGNVVRLQILDWNLPADEYTSAVASAMLCYPKLNQLMLDCRSWVELADLDHFVDRMVHVTTLGLDFDPYMAGKHTSLTTLMFRSMPSLGGDIAPQVARIANAFDLTSISCNFQTISPFFVHLVTLIVDSIKSVRKIFVDKGEVSLVRLSSVFPNVKLVSLNNCTIHDSIPSVSYKLSMINCRRVKDDGEYEVVTATEQNGVIREMSSDMQALIKV
ncbi:ARID/BRIGHT DNA binding domain [Carpediemonas membranifera]|uniref:ARID/BRIGHT DNA binding domain n=1 Tax=Carpediemonas membranifera TaxID=201153 RepID=A0A8J6B5F8_9EUKA|nr:ARID/BRIGHT DNA binding domain [Carpediemonas membranifera]|eukprot:KAG9390417.1 ARID/BRIGHT DNA binding domain [Carpediemonas membranifera]